MNLLHTGEETLMKRRIIKIDENKCNGCGLCSKACHEGAIGMVNGKAKLLRDDYCDGLGDCLPHSFLSRLRSLTEQSSSLRLTVQLMRMQISTKNSSKVILPSWAARNLMPSTIRKN